MKHATIKLGDYDIPLIGIDKSATEYYCDKCQKKTDISKLKLNFRGTEFYCESCRN